MIWKESAGIVKPALKPELCNMDSYKATKQYEEEQREQHLKNCTTECPSCGNTLSALQGSKDAICKNCGFKIPCCGD